MVSMCQFYKGQFHFIQVLPSNRLYSCAQSILLCTVLKIANCWFSQSQWIYKCPPCTRHKIGIHTLIQHLLSYNICNKITKTSSLRVDSAPHPILIVARQSHIFSFVYLKKEQRSALMLKSTENP